MQAKARGLALLEVLVALAVIGVGLMTAAAFQIRGVQAFEQARRESLALQLAHGMLEQVRAVGRMSSADEARWRGQVVEALGASSNLRLSVSGQILAIEVYWSDSRQAQPLHLQGKVLP